MVYFIDWNIITLNGRSIIMTFLFEWMSLLFIGFAFIISSLVILHSDDYMFGDLNIIRFIILVLIFVVSIIFLTKKTIRRKPIGFGFSGLFDFLFLSCPNKISVR